jgi:hypothetical protein
MARALSPLERIICEALEGVPRSHARLPVEIDRIGPFSPPTAEEVFQQHCLRGFTRHRVAPPRKDFIFTPIFTALFSTTFLGGTATWTLFGGAVSLASVASAIATTALTIGLQYALAPKPPKPEDGRLPMAQPMPYRRYGVGQSRESGAFMLWEAADSVMCSVQAIMAHQIDSYVDFYLHDDKVTLGGSNNDTVQPIGERYSDGKVKIWWRLGAVPETPYDQIVDRLGSQDIWTNDHRLDGQASVAMTCGSGGAKKFPERYPYGRPVLSVVGRWAKCWDFRDEDQDPEDPSTWTWTLNPVVQLCWHLCFNPFGEMNDFRRAILPVLDMWQEEADVCDEDVPLAIGGTEKRYTASGVDTTEHGPKAFFNALLAAMDGWHCRRGDGAHLIVAGKYREKYCATLTDADVIGRDLDDDVLFDEEVNKLTPIFNYPATDYSTTSADAFNDVPAQLAAGRVLPQEAHYDFVTAWRQCRRLGKRDFTRLRQKVSGLIYAGLTGLNAAYAPWIRLETPVMVPSLNGKVIANRNTTANLMQGGLQIKFVKMPDDPEDIDAWTPASDEGSAPPVPAKPVSSGIPIPIIDSISVQRSGSSVFLRVSLIDPDRDDLTPAFRYRIKDTGSGSPGPYSPPQTFPDVEPAAGLIVLDTNPVPTDEVLEITCAYVGTNGKFGNYTSATEIETTLDNIAPAALSSFGVTGGLGRATFAVATASDSHLHHINVYRVPNGVTLDKNVHTKITFGAAPGTSFGYTDGDSTIVNLATNGDFAVGTGWTLAAGWTIGTGVLNAAAGSATTAQQSLAGSWTAGNYLRYQYDATRSAGQVLLRLTGGTTSNGGLVTTTQTKRERIPFNTGNNTIGWIKDASFVGTIDNLVYFKETPACAPQGVWDYYAFPANVSNVEGPGATPVTGIVIV